MKMKKIAVVGMKGGVGKTTVTANLGAVLTQHKDMHVLMTDFDPRNQLGLHFGMSATDVVGLAQATLNGRSWAHGLHYRLDRVPFLPFGQVSDAQRYDFERLLHDRPRLLSENLADPAFEGYDVALVDTGPGPSMYFQHVISQAHLLVVVLLADAGSYATLPSIEQALAEYCRPRHDFYGAYYLVNYMDESKRLARDIRAALMGQLGDALLPFVVHYDQTVRESLAFQRPVVDQSLSSQASADFRQLSAWLRDKIAEIHVDDVSATGAFPEAAPPADPTMSAFGGVGG